MTTKLSLAGMVLAAGKGKRMNSPLPKVLHKVHGKTMLEHVLASLAATQLERFVLVLGPEIAPFSPLIGAHPELVVAIQERQNGTGGAVAAGAVAIAGAPTWDFAPGRLYGGVAAPATHLLICAGDCPAIRSDILAAFIADSLAAKASLAVLGIEVDEPRGYGRLIRAGATSISRIVEEKDASELERQIRLCNSGVIFAETSSLFKLLGRLAAQNSQGEYYLTDCIGLSWEDGRPARVYLSKEWQSFLGVNTPGELAKLERLMSAPRVDA